MRWWVTAAVLFAFAPSPALAAPLPSSSIPLNGSRFQGGDGNQDDAGGFVDWQSQPGVVHKPDPRPDSAFRGGSEDDEPGDWDLTTEESGVNPAKANLLDGFSAVEQPGADTFLYLAFTREASNGDTYLAFELNRDPRLWDNGRAEIPCRTTGDVLIAYTAHGSSADITLQRWTTTVADAATGCARRGTLDDVSAIPAGSAQGDLNATAITSRLPGAHPPGSLIPAGEFGETALNLSELMHDAFGKRCFSFASIWMHSRSSHSESSNLQDYVAPRRLVIRTCAASGVKFFDLDADGVRDPGEPGIPRFLIWADYDGDGRRDANEPFAVTDRRGRYVVYDIDPPGGAYTLRETLLRGGSRTSWRCSFPNAGTPGGFADRPGGLFGCGWGPIDVATTPLARDRDFGNWLPAFLSLKKRLWPTGDLGRFDLKVNSTTIVPAGGDGARALIALRPGSYDISEVGALGTSLADYRSAVSCRTTTARRRSLRPGTSWPGLVVRAAGQASCKFFNVRPGVPAIAIEKTGPELADAGEKVSYTLYVTNPGDVAFPAAAVRVTDPICDAPPRLIGRAGPGGADTSPATLDPGDTWTYDCSHQTAPPGDDCMPGTLTNTATVVGTARGTTVTDDDAITTTLACPDLPPDPPLPPEPTPEPEPGPSPVPNPGPEPAPPAPVAPVAPAGPRPPPAGTGGIAGISAVNSGRCFTRASQLRLTGRRISRYDVSLDGRHVSSRTVAILQKRSTPLRRVLSPGRHVLTLRVAFERGSGTPTVTLRRSFSVCAARVRVPQVTG